ncbi:MAG: serine hydrolase [Chloracidobacterium sp.]|nr:serine hydrolase [Chloracidobacterium sp.]
MDRPRRNARGVEEREATSPPGTRFVYSDIGFIVLGRLSLAQTLCLESQHIANCKISFLRVLIPLRMSSSDYMSLYISPAPPLAVSHGPIAIWGKDRPLDYFAPTENVRGQNSYLGSSFEGDAKAGEQILRGMVHDPTSYRMGGVAGHAGLFSTADDLARYCQMLLNGGVAPVWPTGRNASVNERASNADARGTLPNGRVSARRILSAQTVAKMTQPYVVAEDGSARGLGWDMNTSFSSNRGDLFPKGSFGHTGFTGTSIWIDPTSQTFVVFMSNRVHPDGKGDVVATRARVATIAASAIEDLPIEKWKEAEARYNAAVSAQIPRFEQLVRASDFSRLQFGGLHSAPPVRLNPAEWDR